MDQSTQREKSRETLIVDALSEVFALLAVTAATPHVRELRTQARFYDRAIKNWTMVPPTFARLDAMFVLVVELYDKALAVKRSATT